MDFWDFKWLSNYIKYLWYKIHSLFSKNDNEVIRPNKEDMYEVWDKIYFNKRKNSETEV